MGENGGPVALCIHRSVLGQFPKQPHSEKSSSVWKDLGHKLQRTVHAKMKIRTSFTHPLVVLDLFPLSIPRPLSFFCETHKVILFYIPNSLLNEIKVNRVFQNDNKAVILNLYDLKAIPLTNIIYKKGQYFRYCLWNYDKAVFKVLL